MGSNVPRDIDYAALHRRYLAGESGIAIAADIDIKWSGLYRAWDRLGLPRRSSRDAAGLRDPAPYLISIRKAQDAVRGTSPSMATREARARTREVRQIGISHNELRLAEALREAGVVYRQQAAIGPYNVDFVVDATRIALDIDGGGHNPRVNRNRKAREAFIAAEGWLPRRVETRRSEWLRVALAIASADDGDPI